MENFGQKLTFHHLTIRLRKRALAGINPTKWIRAAKKSLFSFLRKERKSRASYLREPPSAPPEDQLWALGACRGAEIRWQRDLLPPGGGSHCPLSPLTSRRGSRQGLASDPRRPPSRPPGLRASAWGFLFAAAAAGPDTGPQFH